LGGQTTDTQGAVRAIAQAPLRPLAVCSGVAQAGREGAEGVVARDGFGISGVIHLALAVTALGLLVGSSQSDGHL